MKEIWKQTWRDIRRQPLLSVLTIVGTAVSIALIMIKVMSLEALTADYGNEPNRSRSLYIGGICDNDDPYNMGYYGTYLAVAVLAGQDLGGQRIDSGLLEVTQDNLTSQEVTDYVNLLRSASK